MSHPDQLREYARDCLRLAQETASRDLKIRLITMAEAWAALAVQSERITSLCASAAGDAVESPPRGTDGAPRGQPVFGSVRLSPEPQDGSPAEKPQDKLQRD